MREFVVFIGNDLGSFLRAAGRTKAAGAKFLAYLKKILCDSWGCGGVEEFCGKRKNGVNGLLTNLRGMLFLMGSLDATLLDREANRSLTTDTMCQNLFDPI